MATMLKNVVIEEDSSNRFQAQVFETSMASIIAFLFIATIFGGVVNLGNGDTAGGIMCFLIGAVLAGVFGYFVGIRRITIDLDADLVYLTFRSLLRKRQQEFPLSDVTEYKFTRSSEGQIVEVEPGEALENRWGYCLQMTTRDGTDHDLYAMRGQHVLHLGHRLRHWLDEHHVLTAPRESQ